MNKSSANHEQVVNKSLLIYEHPINKQAQLRLCKLGPGTVCILYKSFALLQYTSTVVFA